MTHINEATPDELFNELKKRDGITTIHIPKVQAFKIMRCVADDNSIQWFNSEEGYGVVNILVMRQ